MSAEATVEQDLEVVREQEQLLQFRAFNAETAWQLGSRLRQDALAIGAGMTFEVQVAGRTLFLCATDGASAGQMDWIRRKRNVVMRFGRSSYALGLELVRDDRTMEERHALAVPDHAMHGGGFPILLRGTGCVGSVIASGLHQRMDHALVVNALASVLGITAPKLAE